MAKYVALVSFCGAVSMAKDEVREIPDLSLVKDLTQAGYIKEAKAKKTDKEDAKPEKTDNKANEPKKTVKKAKEPKKTVKKAEPKTKKKTSNKK